MLKKYSNKLLKHTSINLILLLVISLSSLANEDLKEGMRLYDNKDYYRAIDLLKRIVQSEPDNPEPHLLLSKCYQEIFELPKFSYELNLYSELKYKKEKKKIDLEKQAKEKILQNNIINKDENDKSTSLTITINNNSIKKDTPINNNEPERKKEISEKPNYQEPPNLNNLIPQTIKSINFDKYQSINIWSPEIAGIDISHSNKYLAYSTVGATDSKRREQQKLVIYDLENKKEVTSFEIKSDFIVSFIRFSKDDKLLFFAFREHTSEKDPLLGRKVNTSIKIFDLQSKKEVKKQVIANELLNEIDLNKDNSNLAFIANDKKTNSYIIRLFEPKTFRKIRDINLESKNYAFMFGYIKYANNNSLAVRDEKGIRIYDNSYKSFKSIEQRYTMSFDFSPDSKKLVSVDNKSNVRLWSAITGNLINGVDIPSSDPYYGNGSWTKVTYSHDGKFLIVSSPFNVKNSLITFIDVDSLKIIKQVKIPTRNHYIVFSSDGKFLVTAGNDYKNMINIWKVKPN